jgi:hypothetical protein
MLENLPKQQPGYISSHLSISSSGSANCFQHDRQSNSQMKNPIHYLKTI